MKLLVTGGAGFIGSNFILYWLHQHPHDFIINLDKLTYAGNLDNLESVAGSSQYQFIKGDICNKKLVEEVITGVDLILHFAAESHVDRSILQPAPFVETNVVGTERLLAASLKHKVKRFHHISTDEVYGTLDLHTTEKFSEYTAYNPRSPYAATKASADHLVRAYYHTYGLPITISNCSNNFGPFQYPEKFIPLAITNLLEGQKVPVYGDGKNVRDWLYVEDHCLALDTIIHEGKIGQMYCIGGLTSDISNIEVLQKILNLMGKSKNDIEFVQDRLGHDVKYAIDWSKIKTELGWEPKHTFDEWLELTVQWYKKNQKWWKKLKNKEYDAYYKSNYHK